MLKIGDYRFGGTRDVDLGKIATKGANGLPGKDDAKVRMQENIDRMVELQDRLYADDRHSLLIILQAMDAAGKDGIIRHVMQGLNPQGTQVTAFKQPSSEELDHDYLWRIHKNAPERGRIGIFNRSHYEDVLVVRVHELVALQKLPTSCTGDDLWDNRYRQIRDYERHLAENGTTVLKFFLHISKEEQRQRFLERIDDPAKNWKFSAGDVNERQHWDAYMKFYEEAISKTGTEYAPWFVIPADQKWASRLIISEVIVRTLQKMNLKYPKLKAAQLKELTRCRELLTSEEETQRP